MDKSICEAASQADTFIELCFERTCEKLKDGADILNQWRNDKAEYSSITNMTGLDFQHYSMHDKSHSVAILNYIEMILGRDRVELLNASDLWLLLESAYGHDIGMSLTYDELCALWKEEQFKNYIKDSLYAETADERKVAAFYDRLDRLVHNKKLFMDSARADDVEDLGEFEEDFDEILNRKCWAVVSERYIMLLYTGYIRKQHPKESQEKIKAYGDKKEKKIARRMYGIVANVVSLHGEDFDRIFTEVYQSDNGFAAEMLHPQFAAAMLRLGDLLDMDSNRFNPRMLKHMGMGLLPVESMLQLKKHESISHLSYSSGEIQAEARSGKFEVCQTVNRWFALLDREVQDLICNWNKIVPEELIGCRLKRCDLKIYYNDEKFDASKQMKFQVDPVRVYDMLIGNNIYESRLDFIREYLQNAMDASKMKLWLDLQEKQVLNETEREGITPYDLELVWYRHCQIEVEVELNWKEGTIAFTFQDHGIGMEKQCIDSLSMVAGDSWRKRSEYASEIRSMPSWLRPTGGFGIGVQSAFMIADSVEFLTRSEKEGIGRKICLESSKKSGTVSEYDDRTAPKGTKVLVSVKMMEFLKEVLEHEEMFDLEDLADNIFDPDESPRIILHILGRYIRQTARYSIVPIRVKCGREQEQYAGMEWAAVTFQTSSGAFQGLSGGLKDSCPREIFSLNSSKRVTVAGEKYEIRYRIKEDRIYLWDSTKGKMVVCSVLLSPGGRVNAYYKGILVKREEISISACYSMDLIYFDDAVGKNLTVNRDMYRPGKRIQYKEDIERYQCILAYVFADNIQEFGAADTAKRIALRTLALELAGAIKLSKRQISKLSETAGGIAVRTIDFEKLGQLEKYLDENSQGMQVKDVHLHLSLLQMYQNVKVDYGKLAESVKKNGCIICRFQEHSDQGDQMKFEIMLEKIKEYRRYIKEGVQLQDFSISWYKVFYKLAQSGCYTIINRDMCDALKMNSGSYDRKELDLVIKGSFVDGITVMEKRHPSMINYSVDLQRYIQRGLERTAGDSRAFPIVLYTYRRMDQEPLWISKIFPNVDTISLDGAERADKSNMQTRRSFLILPFTRKMWNELMREKEKGIVTKEKYDKIVKDKEAAGLLIDWTYCWQIASGEARLEKSKIWENYIKLLDSVYEWIF